LELRRQKLIVRDGQDQPFVIRGTTNTIMNSAGVTTYVGNTQLDGGPVSGVAVTCAGVYDENYTFYASTCPRRRSDDFGTGRQMCIYKTSHHKTRIMKGERQRINRRHRPEELNNNLVFSSVMHGEGKSLLHAQREPNANINITTLPLLHAFRTS